MIYQTSLCPSTQSPLPMAGPGQQKMAQFPPAWVRPGFLDSLPSQATSKTPTSCWTTTDGPELLQGLATSSSQRCCGWRGEGVQPCSSAHTQPKAIIHQGEHVWILQPGGKPGTGLRNLLRNPSPLPPRVPRVPKPPHSLVLPVVMPVVTTDILNPCQKVV